MTDEDRKACEDRIRKLEFHLSKLQSMDGGDIAPDWIHDEYRFHVYEVRHHINVILSTLRRMLATPDAP